MWNEPLDLLELTLPTAAENIALDEALLQAGGPRGWLRLWESSQSAVVLGRSNRAGREADLAACRADGVPVVRRASGGGAVLIGPGCLMYSLVLPIAPGQHLLGIPAAIKAVLERIAAALGRDVPEIAPQGTSDLSVDGRKVSGNSQRWRQRWLLHHGTLLYDFDLARVPRYLPSPSRAPVYRAGRGHLEFIANLPLTRERLRQRLIEAWPAESGASRHPPLALAAELLAARYARDDWNLQR